ncbi:MAG TPA: hypothetical protein VN258_12610 [Mobilitalea sp.]|nr:hypothetical protein [Mobilitalea sp.]
MSYQEKRTIVSIISGLLVLVAYCIYVFGKYQSHTVALDDLKFSATTMLIFIGIGIAATIIIQILFHIALSVGIAARERNHDEKAIEKEIEYPFVEDEMDKLIELKAMKIGFIIGGAGFIAALVTVVFNCSVAVMLNIIFLSFSLGSLAEGILSLHYYRKGVRNG